MIDTLSSRMKHQAQAGAGLALLALLCGCPDVSMKPYQRPESPGKAAWSSQQGLQVAPAEMITQDWWKQFRDPYLDGLIDRALGASFDLKILAARIGVASAEIGEARAGALPTLDAGAGASFEKSTGQKFTKQFNLATQVNWDIDVWGRVAKGVEAQTAEFKATEADWRAGYLTLVSDVSTTYFQILQFDEQINQQQQTLAKNKQILTTYEAMMQNGLVPQTRVLQQRAEINRMSNDLIELGRLRALATRWRRCWARRRASSAYPPAHCRSGSSCRWCPKACHRSCSSAGPTSWPPSTACWWPTTWSARPSWRSCHRSA
jgi:outer membrane protein TolC